MSRVRVFGMDWKAKGEFSAVVDRGWGLNGSHSLQGGMTSSFEVSKEIAESGLLDFGRMIMIEDDEAGLPAWAGMIDTPWGAALPVNVTAYGIEYLASLRTPDSQVVLNGSFISVLNKLILMINDFEDLHIRIGDLGKLPTGTQQLTIKQTPLWGQLNAFAKREKVEFILRPSYEKNEPLTIHLDAGRNIGINTQYYLHDGDHANIQVTGASINQKIINRIIGIGKQDTNGSRLQTQAFTDADSIQHYGLRSEVQQFGNLTLISSLNQAAQNSLAFYKEAPLKLSISVLDSEAFPACRPGNRIKVHASQLWLPGGIVGWSGTMRILQMAYDEKNRVLKTTMEGYYQ